MLSLLAFRMLSMGVAFTILMDSSGPEAWIAMAAGASVLAERRTEGKRFSAAWPVMLAELLGKIGASLPQVERLVVANGPGSFTGVRVGLAAAAGLGESLQVPVVTVSSLAVLQALGEQPCCAAIQAGHGHWYLRDTQGMESTVRAEDLAARVTGTVVVMDQHSHDALPSGLQGRICRVEPKDLLRLAFLEQQSARLGSLEVTANYVRSEGEIYPRTAGTV